MSLVLVRRSSVSSMKARFESGSGCDSSASESPPTSLDSANPTNSFNSGPNSISGPNSSNSNSGSNSSPIPNASNSNKNLSATERRRKFRELTALSEGSLKR